MVGDEGDELMLPFGRIMNILTQISWVSKVKQPQARQVPFYFYLISVLSDSELDAFM